MAVAKLPNLSFKAIAAGLVTVVGLGQLGLVLLIPWAKSAVANMFDDAQSASASSQSVADYVTSEMWLFLLVSFVVSGIAYFVGSVVAGRIAAEDRVANAVAVFLIVTAGYWTVFAFESDGFVLGQVAESVVGLVATLMGCFVLERRKPTAI